MIARVFFLLPLSVSGKRDCSQSLTVPEISRVRKMLLASDNKIVQLYLLSYFSVNTKHSEVISMSSSLLFLYALSYSRQLAFR